MSKGLLTMAIVLLSLISVIALVSTQTADEGQIVSYSNVLGKSAEQLNLEYPDAISVELPDVIEEAVSVGKYQIKCSQDVYTGYDSAEVICSVINPTLDTDSSNIKFVFFPEKFASVEKIYKWTEDVEHPVTKQNVKIIYKEKEVEANATCKEPCIIKWEEYQTTTVSGVSVYDDWVEVGKEEVIGTGDTVIISPEEVLTYKFIIKFVKGTTGKFDIMYADTVLDPWWDTTYTYRYPITENKTNQETISVNDLTGIGGSGKTVWALTHGDAYLYSKEASLTTIAIANDTDQKYWENETTGTGNGVANVYPDATAVYHFMNSSASKTYYNSIDGVATWNSVGSNSGTGRFSLGTICSGNPGSIISLPSELPANTTNAMSYSMWFKLNHSIYNAWYGGATTAPVLFSKGTTQFYNRFESDGRLLTRFDSTGGSDTYSTTAYWSKDNWYNFVLTYDGTNLRMYINGTLETTTPWTSGSNWNSATNITLCNRDATASTTYSLNGTIDEFRIYDKALSATEVWQQYQTGLITPPNNMTALGTLETTAVTNFTYNTTYNGAPYETETTNHTLQINTSTGAVVTGKLKWNGTEYTASATNTTPTNWVLYAPIRPNLVVTNGTTVAFQWNMTFVYTNGTTRYNQTTIDYTQNVVYKYWFATPTDNTTTAYGGEGVRLTSVLTNGTNAIVYNTSTRFNGTWYSTDGDYYTDVLIPMISVPTTFSYYFTFTVANGTQSLFRNSTTSSFTASPILILANGTGMPCINYKYFKEESPYTQMNASHNIMITIWKSDSNINATYNFTLSQNANHTLTIYPGYADVYAFSIEEYWNNNISDTGNLTYPVRNYYLPGTHLTNESQTVNLYLLNSTYADVVGVNAIDRFGDGVANLIVDAQRYYPGENLFRSVARGYTDSEGEAVLRLYKCTGESSVYHKFLLYQNYELIKSYDQMCIIDDVVTLPVSEGSVVDWWNTYGDLSGLCTYYNTTQLLVCEYTSANSYSYDVELYVEQLRVADTVEKCNTTLTATSGSLTCSLVGMTDESYYYTFKAYDGDGNVYIIDNRAIKNLSAGEYNEMGIFIALLLFITMAFIGWQNPFVMMILSIVAMVGGFVIGFYEVTYTGLLSLIIAGAIIMYGVK